MSKRTPTIQSTLDFIKTAHAGQTDKANNPYWKHPFAVMQRLPSDIDEEVKLAALLHDVLEDTPYTRQDLEKMGYTKRTLDIVELVTKKKDDTRSYGEKIDALIKTGNKDAIWVKFADMSENADPERLAMLGLKLRKKLKEKYTQPLAKLRNALGLPPTRPEEKPTTSGNPSLKV